MCNTPYSRTDAIFEPTAPDFDSRFVITPGFKDSMANLAHCQFRGISLIRETLRTAPYNRPSMTSLLLHQLGRGSVNSLRVPSGPHNRGIDAVNLLVRYRCKRPSLVELLHWTHTDCALSHASGLSIFSNSTRPWPVVRVTRIFWSHHAMVAGHVSFQHDVIARSVDSFSRDRPRPNSVDSRLLFQATCTCEARAHAIELARE